MRKSLTIAGVDVGGETKGFDAAIVDARGELRCHRRRLDVAGVWGFIAPFEPVVVAIDSPRTAALPGATARLGERCLNRHVCGIRWTPDERALAVGDYYDWVRRGRELYGLLAAHGTPAIEVFPTASWTRWHGRREGRRRSAWSREALAGLGLLEVPRRTNQDLRDAIAAAVTAWQWRCGETEEFGEIVVPKAGCRPRFERATPAAS